MKVILFFDQLQAGKGGKYDKNVPLGLEKGGVGSYGMFSQYLKEKQMTVVCTIYCGAEYYFANQDDVYQKITNLIKKVNADIVIAGPCFDFMDYAKMASDLCAKLTKQHVCDALVACSKENVETIEQYKTQFPIVKMSKKGEVGLNDSLKNMVTIAHQVVENNTLTTEYLYQ